MTERGRCSFRLPSLRAFLALCRGSMCAISMCAISLCLVTPAEARGSGSDTPATLPLVRIQRPGSSGAGLSSAATSAARSALPSSGSSTSLPDALPRGPEFPHLLMAQGPKDPRPPLRGANANPGRPGVARIGAWDPDGLLSPSVLPARTRDRAEAMLRARTVDEWLTASGRSGPGESGSGTSSGRGPGASRTQVEPDTLRVLVLRVDFEKDTPAHRTSGDGRFDLRRDEEARALPIDPPPHDRAYFSAHMEALSRYYRVISGGSLELTWDIYPAENDSAYHLPDTRKYGPWIFSNSNPDVLQHAIDLVHDSLVEADADSSVDFARYGSVLLFHAGADFQGDMNRDSPWDIPSFNLYVQEPFVVQDSTVVVNLVMVIPESANQDGFYGAMNGVIAHEFGHQLGFADLYDVRTGTPIVGAFSLMDSGENLYGTIEDPAAPGEILAVRGMLPASLDPWHKSLFFPAGQEMLFPEDFIGGEEQQFTAELPAATLENRTLYVPLSLSEYLLLENRLWELNNDSLIVLKSDKETGVILGPAPADSNAAADDLGYREYDYLLPGQGMLAWHIDVAAINAGLSTDFGGVNIFYFRPGVGVEEGDGIRDIGTASNEYTGGPLDPYFLGGYTCLGTATVPSSATNDETPTGVTVCALDSIGPVMRVSVATQQNPAGWPIEVLGEPGLEQILALDLDGDGAKEIVAAADSAILAWSPSGELVVRRPVGSVQHGLAGREGFLYAGGARGVLLAAVTDGRLWMFNPHLGDSLVTDEDHVNWPSSPGAGDSLLTSTPVVTDSLVFAGCADGVIRVFEPDPGGPLRARAQVPGTGDPIVTLGAGRLNQEGHEGDLTVFFATREGTLGTLHWTGTEFTPGETWDRGFGTETGLDRPAPAGLLAAPIGPGGAARYLHLWEDGTLCWYESDGTPVEGWPVHLGADPAGGPILCDADGDGVLETVLADSRARLHVLGEHGVEELHWPRSLWSEDVPDPPVQTLGPVALDVTGEGRPEILIHRMDGMLLALDAEGEDVPGWPRSLGSLATSPPLWIAGGGGYAPRIAVSNAYGSTEEGERTVALNPLRIPSAQGAGLGFFPESGVEPGRSRVYPANWVPSPEPTPGPLAVGETLRLYPNPLRSDQLTVHFELRQNARVKLDAFDLSGRKVADLEAAGEEGSNGNQLLWDLGALAPGLYHVRFRVLGDGAREEIFRKLAIVR